MKIKRNIVTPYLTFLFLIVGLSGILMFFHIFDEYTKVVHELLGLVFVIFSVLHIIVNWAGIKKYFNQRVFIVSGIVIFILSTVFIVIGKLDKDLEREVMDKLVKSPVSHSFYVLDMSYEQAEAKLRNRGIIIGASNTIEEISVKNKKSPKEIMEWLVE